MKYFIDTEFLEGKQDKTFLGFKYGETKPTIDLISIGIVAEDGREYYAITKDFNLKEAWSRYDLKPDINEGGYKKEYWIRENVLKPIFKELLNKEAYQNNEPSYYEKITNGVFYNDIKYNIFTYHNFKLLITKYGKTNEQIAEEIKEFCSGYPHPINNGIPTMIKDTNIEFYAYYADYDWVVFCWLFGKMIDLPVGFPKYCIDLKQKYDEKESDGYLMSLLHIKNRLKEHKDYPKQTNEHNALADAKWNFELYKFLEKL